MKAKTDGKPAPAKYQLKPWKIAGFAAAGLLVAAGIVLAFTGSGEQQAATGDPMTTGTGVGPKTAPTAFGPTQPGSTAPVLDPGGPEAESKGIWSPALLRGGISFFIAFCLAFAFRTFIRLALIFVGIWGASLFFLQYLGWVDVHWDLIDTQFKNWVSGLGDELTSIQRFITGSLPSAGLATLGFITGFKKG